MIKVVLNKAGKKYNREWIFRGVSREFTSGEGYAILGSNGSGKSTLLQLINGNLQVTEGTVEYSDPNQLIPTDKVYRRISLATPYQELIWDFSLEESLRFHQKFKAFRDGLEIHDILEITGLGRHRNKALKYFSSGMKQRVRLAQAILSDTDILLLDEPSMNLDASGRDWYDLLLRQHTRDRLLIVCSNHQEEEYHLCRHILDINQFKP